MVKVTFLMHSGFLVEATDAVLLFDWWKGELPEFDRHKSLYVFASHGHSDHFNPAVLRLPETYPDTRFVLSDDIRGAVGDRADISWIAPGRSLTFSLHGAQTLSVNALPSTDLGVGFVVQCAQHCLYFAGDLNWWAWPDDTPQEAQQMEQAFLSAVEPLKGKSIDLAFLPLDYRLEENYAKGFDTVMRLADVKNAFPMHMWESFKAAEKLLQDPCSQPYRDRIRSVQHNAQQFWLV